MVQEGRAWYYSAYAPRRFDLSEAEWKARKNKSGLWADENPQAPWKWRQENKK